LFEIDLSSVAWIRDADLRQDCIVALLDQKPLTPEGAAAIVRRIRWTHSRTRRRDQRYGAVMPVREAQEGAGVVASLTPVTDAVLALPAKLRKVMILRFVAGRSVEDVAAAMSVSEPTIVRWTKVAMKIVRER
jgi:DNA-directed RNA polymerase specialized sigma24 family protein